jgi:long-subunit fatty acid transport protein
MLKRFAVVLALSFLPQLAYAGGFEVPDNGTEALGRGAAFTAKADDITALQYNIAGLAGQRGWRLMVDQHLIWSPYEFTRSGTYADAYSPSTPWGGQQFPTVRDKSGPFYAPFVGASTDFGKLRRWTFALGVFCPPSQAVRTYGDKLANGWPSPQRYDITQADLLLVFLTAAAAVRVTHWFDLGLALHVTYADLDLGNVQTVRPIYRTKCTHNEDPQCDTGSRIQTNGWTATASLGMMFHPLKVLDVGANVRGPVQLDTKGTVAVSSPAVIQVAISPDYAEFHTKLPWVVRAGARYKFLGHDGFEHGDVEVDGTYESWGSTAENPGDQVNIPHVYIFNDVNPQIAHNFKDTFSVRFGGAWNVRLRDYDDAVFVIRAGAYYDSSATNPADTRMDFDTMEKIAGTFGLGFRWRGVSINAAYAHVWEPTRTVTNGRLQSIYGTNGTNVYDPDPGVAGATPHIINNGTYHASNTILSLNIGIAFDGLLKRKPAVASN